MPHGATLPARVRAHRVVCLVKPRRRPGWLAILAALALPMAAGAAPLDGLLSATPERSLANGFVELGLDHMGDRLDFFRVKESDPVNAGTAAGNYRGQHLSAGVRLPGDLWLSGSFWKRSLSDASDTHNYTSWQVAGQYRLLQAQGKLPTVALRLSGWGNYASAMESSTPVVVPGAKLDTVKISDPYDRQLQADLIGTWNLSPSTDLNLVLSAGTTRLGYGSLSATTTLDGCSYQLDFTGNAVHGVLARPCNAGIYLQEIYDDSGRLGIDVAKEIAWRGRFVQAGVGAVWYAQAWTFRSGYLFHAIKREAVDAILEQRGLPAYGHNHTIVLQAEYRLHARISAFARAQLSSNLFFNEIPVTYNTSTSERFGHRYSLYSVGLRATF